MTATRYFFAMSHPPLVLRPRLHPDPHDLSYCRQQREGRLSTPLPVESNLFFLDGRRTAVRTIPRVLFVALLLILTQSTRADSPQTPQTVAEKSDYKATSRYADVVAFCEALAKRSPA